MGHAKPFEFRSEYEPAKGMGRYLSGTPGVIRPRWGAGPRAAAQHSQSLLPVCTHIPGLKVVAPSTPADAKGLLTAAMRDPNPVVFVEHKLLYKMKGEVPDGEHVVPRGVADL